MSDNDSPPPPTVYPYAKGRVWGSLIVSLTLVAVGVFFLVDHSTVMRVVAGTLAVPFFGFCSVLIAQRLLRDRPELMLDDAGVEHLTLGRFGWDEIAAVRIREMHVRGSTPRFIELLLHDPDAYLARAPAYVRRTASMNARLGFGPASIPTVALPVPPETVLHAMTSHRPGLTVIY